MGSPRILTRGKLTIWFVVAELVIETFLDVLYCWVEFWLEVELAFLDKLEDVMDDALELLEALLPHVRGSRGEVEAIIGEPAVLAALGLWRQLTRHIKMPRTGQSHSL